MSDTEKLNNIKDDILRFRSGLIDLFLLELPGVVNEILQKRTKEGKSADGTYTNPYSRSHTYKRKKEGLQTNMKDLWFSGEMWQGHGLKRAEVTSVGAEMTLGFRFRNQRWGRGNDEIAKHLSEYEGVNLNKLSADDIAEVYAFWNGKVSALRMSIFNE